MSIYVKTHFTYNSIFFVKSIVNKNRKLFIIKLSNSVVIVRTINELINYFAIINKIKKKEIYLCIKYKIELEETSNYFIKDVRKTFIVVQLLAIKLKSQIKKKSFIRVKKKVLFI